MNENAYVSALRNVLMEIGNVCPGIRFSFIFTKEGAVVTGEPPVLGQEIEKVVNSLQSVTEKATSFGGMDSLLIDGSKGKLLVLSVEGMYFGMATSENVDMRYLRLIVHATVPAIFKLLSNIVSAPLKIEAKQKLEEGVGGEVDTGSQDLFVDSLEGFFGEEVQIDGEILEEWSDLFEGGEIVEVVISVSEKMTLCRVKGVRAPELRGKGIIKMPNKIRKFLKVEKGDFVQVIPVTAFKDGNFLINKQVANRYKP